jgi:hypothetical protein
MKNLALPAAAMLLVTVGSWTSAHACDREKTTAAAAAHSGCPSAAQHGTTATTAACLGAHGSAMAADGCGAGTSARVASAHPAKGTAGCPYSGSSAKAMAGCPNSNTAMAAVHTGCDDCSDWSACRAELQAAGAGMQVVPLKNGVMYVFTADTPQKAHAVQNLLARRQDRLTVLTAAGDKAHLCSGCKVLRGAAVSGKLVREVINIDGGCIVMATSPDPTIVSRILAQAGVAAPTRVKS